MVSFHCHGCGDVVKKPKLDQHRTRCHSGYDCIDCSKTFNTPADYKGHTSCISEAEKYEKSLYKGPKTGAQPMKPKQPPASTNHKHTTSTQKAPAAEEPAAPASERQSNAQWGAKSVGPSNAVAPAPTNSYGRGAGAGGYGRYGGWGQSRNKVTGANDTPLGTPPPRASPVNVAPPRTAASSQSNGHAQTQTQKDNKRKSGAADEAVNGDAKSTKKVKLPKEKETTVDPASIPLPSSPGPAADDSKKKHKKDKDAEKEEKKPRKKEKKEKAQKHEETVEMAAPSGEEEKKKKSKKDKKEKGKEEAPAVVLPGEESKANKKKKKKNTVEEPTLQTNGVEVNGKSKKRKRSDEDDAADVGEEEKKKRKEKKEKKKEKTSEDAMDVDATPIVEPSKKEKKNKKEKKDKGKDVESIPIAVAVS